MLGGSRHASQFCLPLYHASDPSVEQRPRSRWQVISGAMRPMTHCVGGCDRDWFFAFPSDDLLADVNANELVESFYSRNSSVAVSVDKADSSPKSTRWGATRPPA